MAGMILIALCAQSWYTSGNQMRAIDQELFAAVQRGNLAEARRVVAKGANVNAVSNDQRRTPLMEAFGRKESLDLVKLLISKGAKVNAAASDGTTPLHMAVTFGNPAVVKELIKDGASLTARTIVDPATDSLNNSPMFADTAALREHTFEPGFNDGGKTPAFEIANHFNLETAEALKQAGADFKAVDVNGWTILHYAVQAGNTDAIKWLLKLGLDPNAASRHGFRPLHVSVRVGFGFPNEPIIKLLLASGANPELKNEAGQTPEELLRSDTAWRLRSTNPDVGERPELVSRTLQIANKTAKFLDSGAKPIEPPKPVIDAHGRRYDPVLLGDMTWDYWVRTEGGHAVLRIAVRSIEADMDLKLTNLMLEYYEPLQPLPGRFPIKKGHTAVLEIPFPAGAARGGGLTVEYGFGSGGGSFSNGWGYNSPEITYGPHTEIKNDDPTRTMLVRFDNVLLNGKPVRSLIGKVIKIGPGRSESGGLPSAVGPDRLSLTYSVNLPPNKRWWHTTFSTP